MFLTVIAQIKKYSFPYTKINNTKTNIATIIQNKNRYRNWKIPINLQYWKIKFKKLYANVSNRMRYPMTVYTRTNV